MQVSAQSMFMVPVNHQEKHTHTHTHTHTHIELVVKKEKQGWMTQPE